MFDKKESNDDIMIPNAQDKTMFGIQEKHLQVVAHLYRGEMNRLTIYRQRLDSTFNWVVSLLTALIVIYLGNPLIPESTVVILPAPVLIFSFIESRRYMYYMLSHHRVRLLEEGFYARDIFTGNGGFSNPKEQLVASLVSPSYPVSLFRCWMVRMYRNYIWLSYLILLSWSIKINLTGDDSHHIVTCILSLLFICSSHLVLYWVHPRVDDA